MALSPLLDGWWVLIFVGIAGFAVLGGVLLYVLARPSKPTPTPMPFAAAGPHPPYTPVVPASYPPPPMYSGVSPVLVVAPVAMPATVRISPDATLPLAALNAAGVPIAPSTPAPRTTVVSPSAPPPSLPETMAPPPTAKNATLLSNGTQKPASKAPLPLKVTPATLLSAAAPSAPASSAPTARPAMRTLPPPPARLAPRPFALSTLAPGKAAEILALQLDSDLPPPPDAPDTEPQLEDDAPTTMWRGSAPSRGLA
jgi:hypothetical protein